WLLIANAGVARTRSKYALMKAEDCLASVGALPTTTIGLGTASFPGHIEIEVNGCPVAMAGFHVRVNDLLSPLVASTTLAVVAKRFCVVPIAVVRTAATSRTR